MIAAPFYTHPSRALAIAFGAMTAHDPWLAAFAILSATLVNEDLATIAAGIAVALEARRRRQRSSISLA